MCGEDVSFCLDAKEAGFEIWCDPRIRVGHEKTRIIQNEWVDLHCNFSHHIHLLRNV